MEPEALDPEVEEDPELKEEPGGASEKKSSKNESSNDELELLERLELVLVVVVVLVYEVLDAPPLPLPLFLEDVVVEVLLVDLEEPCAVTKTTHTRIQRNVRKERSICDIRIANVDSCQGS